ncbi:MAG: MmgE/PrpD family protein [Epsilonproteobacteria bacterium]|nr:MmgE/PrpD family protein [Campylobacterota bacterium]
MDIIDFIKDTKYEDLDIDVIEEAKKCLLDTVGVCIIGSRTELSKIVNNFSKKYYSGDDANSFGHKTKMSQMGALFTSSMSTDAFDMHDGHVLTKGHAGVSIIPAALILHNSKIVSGKELLTNIVVGYEIAIRAGIALHGSTDDYHSSGAWNSLGVCAIACRILDLDKEKIRHALGICEFYAPRAQMMKVIDNPTMLKDGSGFGAFVGLKAALLAKEGFTGMPSLLITSKETKKYWKDLGKKYEIKRQYFKSYPVCRWAQPSIEAIKSLNAKYTINSNQIKKITIKTFHEATRLNNKMPKNTEEAQYSLKYPVILTLLGEDITENIVKNNFSTNKEMNKLFKKVQIKEKKVFSKSFPAKRLASITIDMIDGNSYKSGSKEAIWGENDSPSYNQIRDKFFKLCKHALTKQTAEKIENFIYDCENLEDIKSISSLI